MTVCATGLGTSNKSLFLLNLKTAAYIIFRRLMCHCLNVVIPDSVCVKCVFMKMNSTLIALQDSQIILINL